MISIDWFGSGALLYYYGLAEDTDDYVLKNIWSSIDGSDASDIVEEAWPAIRQSAELLNLLIKEKDRHE
jgi:hypothetical protein